MRCFVGSQMPLNLNTTKRAARLVNSASVNAAQPAGFIQLSKTRTATLRGCPAMVHPQDVPQVCRMARSVAAR